VDETGGALRLHQHWSTPDIQGIAAVIEAAGKIGIKRGEGMMGSVWQSGKPLWIRDYLQQAGAERIGDELFEKMGSARRRCWSRCARARKIVGVLRFGSRAMRAPDERLSDRLSALGAASAGSCSRRRRAVPTASAPRARAASPTCSSDWYWETDASHCFTASKAATSRAATQDLRRRLNRPAPLGKAASKSRCGWDAHRALLDARKPFYDALMWRPTPKGAVRYLSVSGERCSVPTAGFLGYHGVGRDVSAQKAGRADC